MARNDQVSGIIIDANLLTVGGGGLTSKRLTDWENQFTGSTTAGADDHYAIDGIDESSESEENVHGMTRTCPRASDGPKEKSIEGVELLASRGYPVASGSKEAPMCTRGIVDPQLGLMAGHLSALSGLPANNPKAAPIKEEVEDVLKLQRFELAEEAQQVHNYIFSHDSSGELGSYEFSLTIADPHLEDCPLVGCSSGFSKLSGYELDEIVGRNCRFLVEPVPAVYQVSDTRQKARAFCDAVTPVPSDSTVKQSWEPHGHRENLDGIFCIQVNMRKDGTLFSNMFFMKHVMLDQRTLIVGLQTELPYEPAELKNLSSDSQELKLASLLLQKKFVEVEKLLARMFWFSAELRRQDYGKECEKDADSDSTGGIENEGELGESTSPRSHYTSEAASVLSESKFGLDSTAAEYVPSQSPLPASEADFLETLEVLSQSVRPWPEDHVRFISTLKLAPRNHGEVNLVEMDSDSKGDTIQVAVKKIPKKWMRSSAKAFVEKFPNASENPWQDLAFVDILNRGAFPHVNKLVGLYKDHTYSYVAYQLCEEGDLFDWTDVCKERMGPEREGVMRPLVQQICSATRFIHMVGIAHRDLSLENILLSRSTGQLQTKIIDFGASTLGRMHMNERRGKRGYCPPEMHCKDEAYDAYLSDVFSLGVVFFAMSAQDYPFTSTTMEECKLFSFYASHGLPTMLRHRKLRQGDYMANVMTLPFIDFLTALLKIKPSERATLAESCWKAESEQLGKERLSVWDLAWLQRPSVLD